MTEQTPAPYDAFVALVEPLTDLPAPRIKPRTDAQRQAGAPYVVEFDGAPHVTLAQARRDLAVMLRDRALRQAAAWQALLDAGHIQ